MAAIDPIKALGMVVDENGKPDVGWVENLARNVPATKAVDFLAAIETSHPELLGVCSGVLNALAGEQAHRDPEFTTGWFDRFVARSPGMPTWASGLFSRVAAAAPARPRKHCPLVGNAEAPQRRRLAHRGLDGNAAARGSRMDFPANRLEQPHRAGDRIRPCAPGGRGCSRRVAAATRAPE